MVSRGFAALMIAALLGGQSVVAYEGLSVLREAKARANLQRSVQLSKRSATSKPCTSPSCYRYYNNETEPYFVKSLPDVPFALGELYAGSVPINKSDPSRTLFYMFKPAMNAAVDEVTIYLNGGPGCSSLISFLEENGPFLWQPGTQPFKNAYTWAKTTNMLWVDQPVGTGFAQGKVTATNEVDIAVDFVSFFKNWQEIFGIKDYKIYLAGESYAGRYVPYIGAQMLDQKDKTYYNLSGALVYDPCIGDCSFVQKTVPLAQSMTENNAILNLNSTALAGMNQMADRCGYTAYLDKYLSFPPPGHQPNNNPALYAKGNCAIGYYQLDLLNNNECFNIYHITDYCPLLPDVLSPTVNPYFNRKDVKQAIHAPLNVQWEECAFQDVFVNGKDTSEDSIIKVLPQVIEATNRVLVANGDWDGLIITNGTLMNIQNMTWNGKLGFQSAPSQDFIVPLPAADPPEALPNRAPPQGVMGKMHYERGLQWVETYQCGHTQPQYQPAAAYRHLEWLLGRVASL